MRKALLALPILLVASSAAQAQSSISCMYMLLRVYHAELDYCKVALPKAREDRYSRMKSGMETFIHANAKVNADKLISGIDDNIKRALSGLKSCNSDDFKLAGQAMDQLTEPENEKNVLESLKYPRDPQAGSCGS